MPISDLSAVSAARTFINTHPDPIPPSSSLYLQRSSSKNQDGSENQVVVGMQVIFKAGYENGLYEAFNVDREQRLDPSNPKVAVKSLLIACDSLEMHGELSLPECDIQIYARKLIFKDNGAINTSPLPWSLAKAADANPQGRTPGQDGAHGRHAGSFRVFIGEMITREDESKTRFVAHGGKGQDAGLGRSGKNGGSMPSYTQKTFVMNDSGIKKTYCHAKFSPPAVYVDYQWRWAASRIGGGKLGANRWPGDGENALAPGIPGDGGNGGAFVTNHKVLVAHLDNSAGCEGARAGHVTGGSPGAPIKSSHYKLTLWHDWIKRNGSVEASKTTHASKTGRSYEAKPARQGPGSSPAPVTVDCCANAWVYPLQLQCVLSYARDAFLADQRDELVDLLQAYDQALRLPPPTDAETGAAWSNANAAQWTAAQAEVAAQLQRLQMQLDYFGNPAGYMPLLSLQGTMQLYDITTRTALRTLLLANWVADNRNAALNAADAFGDAIDSLNDDTRQVAGKMIQAEAWVRDVSKRIDALSSRLEQLGVRLETLRNKLLTEAEQDLNLKAQIKFGVKMAAAICQVVPVGQPVLGTVGNLAGVAADYDENGPADTVGKIGDVLTKARDAANKSKKAGNQARDEKKSVPAKDEKAASSKAALWATAGDGLGPALSQVGQAIAALQVPQAEIDAELQRLQAESPQWNELVEDIRELNAQKAEFFTELTNALQALGDGYGRLAGNADAVVTLQQQRSKDLAKVDPEAARVVMQLAQRARFALLRSLYLMVKAYETTVFKPITINWQLNNVFDKINELLKPGEGFDAEKIGAQAEVLEPLFQSNLESIKHQLLDQYGFGQASTMDLEFGLTTEQTPAELARLNEHGHLPLDPLAYGLILPQQQRVSLARIELTAIEFDKSGPPLPASGNAIISLRAANNGTMRVAEQLYAVRSDAPRIWSWTYHFGDGSRSASVPSTASLDLLNILLKTDDTSVKQKLASPPTWSDLLLGLEFTPQLAKDLRPRVSKLLFKVSSDSFPAPDAQAVLDVRGVGAGAVLKCYPHDLAGRADGYGNVYRIYAPGTVATLQAPSVVGRMHFSGWEVLDQQSRRTYTEEKIQVRLQSNVLAYCRYQAGDEIETEITHDLAEEDIAAIADTESEGLEREAVVNLLHSTRRAPAPPVAAGSAAAETGRLIRAGAGADYPVIGIVPEGHMPTILEEVTAHDTKNRWEKVLYHGLVGYLRCD